jgi:hypothetical protein
MKDTMLVIIIIIGIILLSYLVASVVFYLLSVGFGFTFSWSGAFGFWILGVWLSHIFKNSTKG